MSIVYLGALIGFAAAITNPFTVQLAQGIAEVPPWSGILFRVIFFVVCMTVAISYVLYYGHKVKTDPSRSVIAGNDLYSSDKNLSSEKLKVSDIWIIIISVIIFALIIYAI